MMIVRSKFFFRNFVTLAVLGLLSGAAHSSDAAPEPADEQRIDVSAEQRRLLDKTVTEQAEDTLRSLNAEWLADVEVRLNPPNGVPVAAN